MYRIAILIVVIIALLILVIWFAYSVTSAYQQTLTIVSPFKSTYRYTPRLDMIKKFQLDSIKIKVSGNMILGKELEKLVYDHILEPCEKSLIVHESNIFSIEDKMLRKYPVSKQPTVENLSILFFAKLEDLIRKKGAQLISVTIDSEGIKASQTRYKATNYNHNKVKNI